MTRFFTADPHFRHKMVLTKMGRGDGRFSSVEEHDDHIIDRINQKVGEKDELYILGDIAWADLTKIRPRINCRHIKVVVGNHDSTGQLKQVFGEAPDTREIRKFGGDQTCFLSHYPHAFWPRSHHGSYHLYGHMHAKREATLNEWMPERRSMDVGVDNAARLLGDLVPFSEAEILQFLIKSGHDNLEFYEGPNAETDHQ